MPQPTRREQQRQATYDEIVRVSRDLLAEGEQVSLRAVAGRMGLTAPALYRYVASYQELVDLVTFELDKAATVEFAGDADRYPSADPAARLTAACAGFRRWALTHPGEFHLCFLNPVADGTDRRELLTVSTSGLYMNGLLWEIWEKYRYPYPALEELPGDVREAVLDPMIPADADVIPPEDRGLLWVWMRAWTAFYGVVTLEVSGHCDPRVLTSGALFRATLLDWVEPLGLGPERDRIAAVLDEEMSRG